MISEILPSTVAAIEVFADPPDAVLLPEERAVIAHASVKRQREFTTVRHCARQAMAKLGRPGVPILPGDRGCPQWPAGLVGSMTHCTGYRAAAVAITLASVGIDAEPHAPLPAGVLDMISNTEERAMLTELRAARPKLHWDRLLFCAKESVYKAWFPLTGRWLGFEDAEVTVDAERGTFTCTLLVAGPMIAGRRRGGFTGRWLIRQNLIVSAIAVDV